jgi:ubiquinone/menaquinone biosynthesis C-methylase UbiE
MARSVFEVYAHEYDLITSSKQREPNHRREVQTLVKRFHPETVLDAGCAAGLTAALFAEEGVTATGLDRSRAMLDVARGKYGESDLPLSFRHGSFEKLPKSLHNQFDLVVCIANSISGVGSLKALGQAITNFHKVLRNRGWLVLQSLNLGGLTPGEVMPVKATRHGDVIYERFVEGHARSRTLYVTRADFSQSPPKYEVFRHESELFDVEQISRACGRAGFDPVRRFGDLHLTKRFSKRARDIVIIAQRRD